jgi:PBP1b-binding outer membrane lipoprotein LpoB
MLLLPDNKYMITVRDLDPKGSLKITNLVNKETVVLETLDIKNLLVRSVAISSNEKLLLVAVDDAGQKKSTILCYDLKTKT